MSDIDSVDVDHPIDYELAKILMGKRIIRESLFD